MPTFTTFPNFGWWDRDDNDHKYVWHLHINEILSCAVLFCSVLCQVNHLPDQMDYYYCYMHQNWMKTTNENKVYCPNKNKQSACHKNRKELPHKNQINTQRHKRITSKYMRLQRTTSQKLSVTIKKHIFIAVLLQFYSIVKMMMRIWV